MSNIVNYIPASRATGSVEYLATQLTPYQQKIADAIDSLGRKRPHSRGLFQSDIVREMRAIHGADTRLPAPRSWAPFPTQGCSHVYLANPHFTPSPARFQDGDIVYSPADHSVYAVVHTEDNGRVALTWSREEVNQRRHQDHLRKPLNPSRLGLGALLRDNPAPACEE